MRLKRKTFYQNLPRLTPGMIEALTRKIEGEEKQLRGGERVFYVILPVGGKRKL